MFISSPLIAQLALRWRTLANWPLMRRQFPLDLRPTSQRTVLRLPDDSSNKRFYHEKSKFVFDRITIPFTLSGLPGPKIRLRMRHWVEPQSSHFLFLSFFLLNLNDLSFILHFPHTQPMFAPVHIPRAALKSEILLWWQFQGWARKLVLLRPLVSHYALRGLFLSYSHVEIYT